MSLHLCLPSPLHVADPVFPFAGPVLDACLSSHVYSVTRLTHFPLRLALALSPHSPVYLHSLQTDTRTHLDLESGYGRKCGICSFTAFMVLSAMKLANFKL